MIIFMLLACFFLGDFVAAWLLVLFKFGGSWADLMDWLREPSGY
jgi:hypothetical protein